MPKQKAVDMVAKEVSKIESEPYEDYYVTRFGRLIAEALIDGSVDIGDKSAAEKLIEQLTRKDVSKWQAEHVASKVLSEDKASAAFRSSELEEFSNKIARALDRAEPELDGAARSMVKEIAKMEISDEDIADSGIRASKTVEEKMGDLRRVTHIAGKGIMYTQDKLGDAAEWAFDKYERFDPVKAALLKGYAVATAISINRGFEYIGKFVPDDVKKEYQKFLDNTTPEEREFWTTVVTLGAGKVATVGVKTFEKLDKIEDVLSKSIKPKYNVPENVIGHEAYKIELRSLMERPNVKDPELHRIMRNLYKEHATVGSGSTADALRHEIRTGKPVGGKFHDQKVNERIVNLERWIKNNPTASLGDRAAAENVLKDLQNAMQGMKK